ncbi:MAG: hypothetical protein WCY78_06140 [Sphaerochaetaceae bacterium]
MKKLLTILLALLLVTGVVFAEEGEGGDDGGSSSADVAVVSGESTLTLKSAVDGYFEHGFAKALTGEDSDLGDNSYSDISMTGTGASAVDLGFYVVKTNAAVAFDVGFVVTPMVNGFGNAYVPYTLNFVCEDITGSRKFNKSSGVTATPWEEEGVFAIGFGEGVTGWSEVSFDSASGTVISHGSMGNGYLALALSADFGTGNDNANLPEGDYTGTVVATIAVN